jgi:hypothetical protein
MSHKIAILDDASSKLILGRLLTRNGTTLSLRTRWVLLGVRGRPRGALVGLTMMAVVH